MASLRRIDYANNLAVVSSILFEGQPFATDIKIDVGLQPADNTLIEVLVAIYKKNDKVFKETITHASKDVFRTREDCITGPVEFTPAALEFIQNKSKNLNPYLRSKFGCLIELFGLDFKKSVTCDASSN